jgi:hypothetical protein
VDSVHLGILWLLSSLACTATAAVTSSVVELPSRGGTQRILYVRPDAPVANIVSIAGGSGAIGLQNDGTLTTREGTCGPLSRNRSAYAASGVAVALLDQASDGSVADPIDVQNVVRFLQAAADVPTWIVGISAGIQGVVANAQRLPEDIHVGFFALNPDAVDPTVAGAITRPFMVVIHQDDANGGVALFSSLTRAVVRDIAVLDGGSTTVCNGLGHHVFGGQDEQLLATIRGMMDKHANRFPPPPPAVATAVEFYHAGLDHYFVTHIANEISLLDAGTTIQGWARTGQSFMVYAGPQAGSSPVCRFYIPPDRGNSHFYGRGVDECDATAAANPTFVLEDAQFFHLVLPVAGACPTGTRNVYRTFSNRADANHRYMVDPAIRDSMVARRWVAEGDGDNLVVMCSPM